MPFKDREALRAYQSEYCLKVRGPNRKAERIEKAAERKARRLRSNPLRKLAACDARFHALAPDGDIERMRANLLEEAIAARALLPPDMR